MKTFCAKTQKYKTKGKLLCLLLTLTLLLSSALPLTPVLAAGADVPTSLTQTVRGEDGKIYRVTASFTAEAGIPDDAVLSVSEISKDDEAYRSYVSRAKQVLRCSLDSDDIRLFDISLVSGADASVSYQPAPGAAVDMKVRLADYIETELGVVHYGETAEQVESEASGRTVSFEATGFSVYGFVAVEAHDDIVHDVSAIDDMPVYLSATTKSGNTYFLAEGTTSTSNTGVVYNRTAMNSTEGAATFVFEPAEGDNRFRIYIHDGSAEKQYLYLPAAERAQYSSTSSTVFTVTPGPENYPDTFYIAFTVGSSTYFLNLRKDENGRGFNGSTWGLPGAQFSTGSLITACQYLPSDDVLDLDGKTYGIAWLTGDNTAVVLCAQARDAASLSAISLPVRGNPLYAEEDVMINVNGDIDMFTFHAVGNKQYYITTVIGGATKYLRSSREGAAQEGALTLVDTPDESCKFEVLSGTGSNSGRLRIRGVLSGLSLSQKGGVAANGFWARNASGATEYLMLAEPSYLTDDDIVAYTAIKVSVSDTEQVTNGSRVILYTRIWNESKKQYEFYAVDHDGSLVRCFDEGDTIRWAGTQINTLLWEFTEYYYEGTTDPNYYYELQNVYSGKYIAPQYHTGQILSDSTIGINLNGRRYGDYYSTVLAWDDFRYDYAGLKTASDGSSVTAVPMSKAQDFYFAVMDETQHDVFPSVETVDNADHGITMRLVNFQGEKYESGKRDRSQTNVMGAGSEVYTGGTVPRLGLVTTDLDENGYPVATRTDKSLQELFNSAEDVNHLFLKKTYEESGYFEFNSTQTFATLLDNGDFRVYNQLGTVETDSPSQGHGWFMPFNDISPDFISSYTNVTDVQNNPLASNDPRLGEELYGIPLSEAQYHFGMEMSASFIQSKDGLDAWGHDIIFEFTGDDDMWLYVDGELVLDLGGVHSALRGNINFRTGDVSIPDASGQQYNTTLRAIFEQNYITRYPNASAEEVQAHLDEIFKPGTSVFRDYTSHTMKMYYMERGAGASNLHMRFNLTTAVNGQLLLSKAVSGTDKQDYASARFPYQIHYYDKDYAAFRTVSRNEAAGEGGTRYVYTGVTYVNYAGGSVPVEYADSYEGYENVFFLKPGEVAEIQFPDDKTEYYITECYVNGNIYDEVRANDVLLTGEADAAGFMNYSTEPEVIGERKVVNFDNHVSPDALRILSITKNLYDVDYNRLTYTDDDTGFRFRIYIGEDGNGEPQYYRMDSYYVRDPDGNYCRYDHETQRFSSLGKTSFAELTEEDLDICTFTTSPSGAIDKIPADFTVEIRNLLIDTPFYIEERRSDIPKGYDLIGYDRLNGSYLVEDGETANSGRIRDSADPHVIVKNHRGWGLTVQKVWSDADFMRSHDNIYFAVFYNGSPVPGAVRRLRTQVTDASQRAETSVYFYFKDLIEGAQFADYTVREVALTDPVVDDEGVVTGWSSLTVLGGETQLINGGVPVQTDEYGTFAYAVSYTVGEPAGPGRNVRTDTVTNARPGVKIVKVDGNGDPLSGAKFTLTDENGQNIQKSVYVSDAAGLVTCAYPEQDSVYVLTEIAAPNGYTAAVDAVTLSFVNNELTVTGGEDGAVTVTGPDADGMITVRVVNFKSYYIAVKKDAVTDDPVSGARFALYKQEQGKNGPMKDYFPLTGYEALITDDSGVIPQIDGTLPAGTYYLTETAAPRAYLRLETDIVFSLNAGGEVTLLSNGADETLSAVLNDRNELVYTLSVPNRRTLKTVRLTPQTLVADFGLDINCNVTDNNYLVPEGSVYTYIGVVSAESFDAYGAEAAPALLGAVGSAYEGAFGTLTLSADGTANYKIGTMQFTGEDVFYLAAHVTRIGGEAADVYVYETLTYIPATTVYYEDGFVSDDRYHNGVESAATGYNFGKWAKVTSGAENVAQAADYAGSDSANIFGYDPGYTDFAVYSNNAAHKVSVGDVNSPLNGGAWPYMEFDFAGTGFDLISVTGGDTGLFTVRVYSTSVDAQGNTVQGEQVVSKAVDTFYGCDYGRLYLSADGAATLEPTGRPLYLATGDIVEQASPLNLLSGGGRMLTTLKTYYDTKGETTETPYYYDDAGAVTATVYYVNTSDPSDVRAELPKDGGAQYVPNYAYALAEGWVVNNASALSLYQIPVIRVSGLTYGTYRAHIEPRFTARYGHYRTVGGYDYFDLYVDAFRIYDPAGSGDDGSLTSAVISEAYQYSDEAYEKFTTVKSVILGAEDLGVYGEEKGETREGAVLVDGSVPLTTERIADYAQFGPNNELYLSREMSVAFELSASAVPADVQLQLRKISDNAPTLRVVYYDKKNNVYTGEIELRTSTDLSYSLFDLIGRDHLTWTRRSDGMWTTGLIIVSNAAANDSLISLTNLKWTFRNAGKSVGLGDAVYQPAFSSESARRLGDVLRFARQDTAVLPDGEAPAVRRNGRVTLKAVSGENVDALVVMDAAGNRIDAGRVRVSFAPAGEGSRRWTVTVTDGEEAERSFILAAQSNGLVAGDGLRFYIREDEVSNDSDISFLRAKLSEFWNTLFSLMNKLLSTLGCR